MIRRSSLVLLALVAACGGGGGDTPDAAVAPDAPATAVLDGPVVVDVNAPVPEKLSAYKLFLWSPSKGFTFNERVVPYDLNTPLFSDYALKQRAIYVPPGQTATFTAEAAFEFPVGSVIVKNFYFPSDYRTPTANLRLIETRLMVRHADGWHPLPYIWDEAQHDATFTPAGEVRNISFTDADGAAQTAHYLIPQRNQCESCHATQDGPGAPLEMVLIGIKARHLNRSYPYAGGAANQIEKLTAEGMLSGAPPVADIPAAYDFRPIEANGSAALAGAELDRAARSYLDINCAHCHNPKGVQGATSQLFLNHDNTDEFRLGKCKKPGSAGSGNGGFVYDIVPGDPEHSILYFRAHTTLVGAMMPLLGRSLVHARGTALLHQWIAAMPAQACATQ